MKPTAHQPNLRQLRGLAHGLSPELIVGHKGVTQAVVDQLDQLIGDHELVKIKLALDDRQLRKQAVAGLCTTLGLQLVQSIGKTATLYRTAGEHQGKHSRIR